MDSIPLTESSDLDKSTTWYKDVTIDCESAFPNDTLPQANTSLNLEFLDSIRLPEGRTDDFIPKGSIFLRQEVIDTFKELTLKNRDWCQILIGSPGVGKSVLLFIVALFQASVRRHPVFFIRKTQVSDEDISVFYIRPDSSQTHSKKVIIDYSRNVDKVVTVFQMEQYLITKYPARSDSGESIFAHHKRLKTRQQAFLFLDGLKEGSDDLKSFTSYHYLSTSAGHDEPSGEQSSTMDIVILSAWEKEDLQTAISDSLRLLRPSPRQGRRLRNTSSAHELSPAPVESSVNKNVSENAQDVQGVPRTPKTQQRQGTEIDDPDEEFEDVYFHTGGRIREAIVYLDDPEKWKKKKERMLNRIDTEHAKLAVTDTKSHVSEKSLDSLRTMFSSKYHPGGHQIVDSQFFARKLRDRLGPETYFNAYRFAMEKNLKAAAGCHFEELMHECFKTHPFPSPVKGVIQAEGKGQEGVLQLTGNLMYWIPSVPNFANIDAAFVDSNMKLFCIQYTVSSTHAFDDSSFRVKFLRPLARTIKYNEDEVEILFVIPSCTEFSIPENARENFICNTVSIDCSSIETVQKLPFPFLEQSAGE